MSKVIAERYRLVEQLGQGGMGRVWAARDELLDRDVAIKELVPPPRIPDSELAELRERAIREARAIARLDHPNVVRVLDVVFRGDDPWIVGPVRPVAAQAPMVVVEGPAPCGQGIQLPSGGGTARPPRLGMISRHFAGSTQAFSSGTRVSHSQRGKSHSR